MGTEEHEETTTGRPRLRLPDHPVRVALLDLLAQAGTLTSSEAAGRLGLSSGLCSFHLRQLARYGLIEEAPHGAGRARPWRLCWGPRRPETPGEPRRIATGDGEAEPGGRPAVREASFACELHLTAEESAGLAGAIEGLLSGYRERERRGAGAPAGAEAVTVTVRLSPARRATTPGPEAH